MLKGVQVSTTIFGKYLQKYCPSSYVQVEIDTEKNSKSTSAYGMQYLICWQSNLPARKVQPNFR